MIVVSTAGNPPPEARARCLASVAAQTLQARHVYLDGAEQTPRRPHFANLLSALEGVPDDEVVVSLDGDDWLAHPCALERVQREHDAGALVTYGSFVYADGRPGFAAPVDHARLRSTPWTATHLKTYRAGLLRRIRREHLMHRGEWLEHARDLAVMYPVLEMAGPERSRYLPDVLCVYNWANSSAFNGDAAMFAWEREQVAYVRSLPPYEQLP